MSKLHEMMDNENSKVGGFMLFFYYRRYKYWQKFIHRFNYHHMELSYPDGETLAWCHWCGLRDKVYDAKATETSLREAVRANHTISSELAQGVEGSNK